MEKSGEHTDESIDEPNPKRPKIESEGSTSPKPETNDPLLPPDVISNIITYVNIPIPQWPSLELLDTNFRAATLIAWRQLRNVNLTTDCMIKLNMRKNRSTFAKCVKSILQKLVERSPLLTSLGGIDIQSDDASLNSDIVQLLAQFEHLESITVGCPKLIASQREIRLEDAVEYLESTRSRLNLKELQLYNVDSYPSNVTILDRFHSSFASGREIGSPLKLETFSFTSIYPLYIRLDTLDTSRLIDLRLGNAWVEPDQLTNLIQRASSLRRMELSFLKCNIDCKGPRLEANKKLLTALASHENWTALKFGKTWGGRCACMKFEPQFIQMLKDIGRRGQLRKLSLVMRFFVFSSEFGTIHTDLSTLRSIKLDGSGCTSEFVRLAELEEIDFMDLPLTSSDVDKIVQLQHLKRFAFKCCYGYDALKDLAIAPTLMDLRVRDAHSITANVFEKWSDGFASKLHVLMLGRACLQYKYAEEGLVRLLEKTTKLRVLILDGRITDRSLMTIATSCPDLEILGVRSTSTEITVHRWQQIVDRCPKLKRLGGIDEEIRGQLQFPKCRNIGDVDVEFWDYDFDSDEYN